MCSSAKNCLQTSGVRRQGLPSENCRSVRRLEPSLQGPELLQGLKARWQVQQLLSAMVTSRGRGRLTPGVHRAQGEPVETAQPGATQLSLQAVAQVEPGMQQS